MQSSRTAELEATRLRAELDQANATLRAKDAELAAVQHKLAAAESAAARPAPATPAPAAAPGKLHPKSELIEGPCICYSASSAALYMPLFVTWRRVLPVVPV